MPVVNWLNPACTPQNTLIGLRVSNGQTLSSISSCKVANSTLANSALAQLVGYSLGGSHKCYGAPDPNLGYVAGVKVVVRASLRSGVLVSGTFYICGCDVIYTYRNTTLTDGDTFSQQFDLISSASARVICWALVVGLVSSLIAFAL
jgi:hypothetical protein